MARKMQTLFIDDLDGSEADGTVRFGLDGAEYEIDLNTEHSQALRTALGRYASAARRSAGPGRHPGATGDGPRRRTRASNAEIRDWARTQGIDIKERGRMPAEVIVRFHAATGK
ncbi:MAG: Lsr2 family protein [Streptosporangiaceae bacterium]|nr:Lsr2 family protein [Streptosporangiaceae bacterium]